MFDRVADEDVRDAHENAGSGDEGTQAGDLEDGGGGDDLDDDDLADLDDLDGERVSAVARRAGRTASDSEPPAVKQIRELVEAVRSDEAVSAELVLLAEKLRSMGGAGGGAGAGAGAEAGGGCCGPELWRRVR